MQVPFIPLGREFSLIMGAKEKNTISRRLFRLYVSSVVSIALLLFLVGVFAIMALGARNLSNFFKENIRVATILKEDVQEAQAVEYSKIILAMRPVKDAQVVSKEQGTKEMKELLGEDFLDVFESNPIPVTINVFVKPEYFVADSIANLREELLESPLVEDVVYQEDVIVSVNRNLRIGGIIFIILAALLLFISTVLINNTVRLNIFSRRFAVHTMQLVGATRGFIRKPFLQRALLQGLISALLAIAALVAVGFLARHQFAFLFSKANFAEFAAIAAALIVFGVALCYICTWGVVRKMLNMSVNDLYY